MGRGAGKCRITCRFECCDKCELSLLAVEREHVHIHAHIHKAYTYICLYVCFGGSTSHGFSLATFSAADKVTCLSSLSFSQFHLSVLVSVAAAAANWVSAMTQFPPTDEPPLHTPQPSPCTPPFSPSSCQTV